MLIVIQNVGGRGIARNLPFGCCIRRACSQTVEAAIMNIESFLSSPNTIRVQYKKDGSYGILIDSSRNPMRVTDFVVESNKPGIAYLIPKTDLGRQLFDEIYTGERQ